MKSYVSRFKKLIPSALGLAALLALSAAPALGAMDREAQQTGFTPRWYDPQAWFESGGAPEHQTDWYDYSFGYNQPADHGQWGPFGATVPYGYYGERPLNQPALNYGPAAGLNFYTTDWYNQEGMLRDWF